MKNEIILRILGSLDSESKIPSREELGLDLEQFGEILDIMQQDKLIIDAIVARNGRGHKVAQVITSSSKITTKGIEYLEKNKA